MGLFAAAVFLARALQYPDPMNIGGDLHKILVGAQLLYHGENVYQTQPLVDDDMTGLYSVGDYPFPAFVAAWPFSFLAPLPACTLWVFATSALLAWLLAARGRWPLLIMLTYPMLKTYTMAKFEPLELAGLVAPWAAMFILCKPHVGLPILFASPDRRRLLSIGLAFLASLLLMPSWPLDWLEALPTVPGLHQQQKTGSFGEYSMPLLQSGGFLLLLALVRWRDWRARLLLGCSLMPQALNFNHQLLLGFIPQTRRRMLIWFALNWLGAGLWLLGRWWQDWGMAWEAGAWACRLTVWLPSLWMVLFPAGSSELWWEEGQSSERPKAPPCPSES